VLSHLTPLFSETFSSTEFVEIPAIPSPIIVFPQYYPNITKGEIEYQKRKEMPPRSVCLNVWTNSLGESNPAVSDGNAMMGVMGGMERRDSAQSGMFQRSSNLNSLLRYYFYRCMLIHESDIPPRSSSGSYAQQPTSSSTSPVPAFNRADLFHSLRPMASTESLNVSLTSKRKF
jgi:hypothetical protein